MITIILGAGASYDCVNPQVATATGQQPPMANGLLRNVPPLRNFLRQYQLSETLAARIDAAVQGKKASLEEEVERFAMSGDYLMELAGLKFYLRDVFRDISGRYFQEIDRLNNYATLVDFLRHHMPKEQVTFITFNYDTLLERAMGEQTGVKFRSVREYTDVSPYKVLKLHGSSNWGRQVPGDDPYKYILEGGDEPTGEIFVETGTKFLYPAIGLPVTSKTADFFECPKGMLEEAEHALEVTDRLLIIGWKGREAHFNESYLKKLKPGAKVQVVSSNYHSADEIRRYIQAYIPDAASEAANVEGFSGYMAHEELLSAFLA